MQQVKELLLPNGQTFSDFSSADIALVFAGMNSMTKTMLRRDPKAATKAAICSLAYAVNQPPTKGPTIIPIPYDKPSLPSLSERSAGDVKSVTIMFAPK